MYLCAFIGVNLCAQDIRPNLLEVLIRYKGIVCTLIGISVHAQDMPT